MRARNGALRRQRQSVFFHSGGWFALKVAVLIVVGLAAVLLALMALQTAHG